jgi:hypothetical protein
MVASSASLRDKTACLAAACSRAHSARSRCVAPIAHTSVRVSGAGCCQL